MRYDSAKEAESIFKKIDENYSKKVISEWDICNIKKIMGAEEFEPYTFYQAKENTSYTLYTNCIKID